MTERLACFTVDHLDDGTAKLRKKASTCGRSSRRSWPKVLSLVCTGRLTVTTSSVMAMANTPSLKATVRENSTGSVVRR